MRNALLLILTGLLACIPCFGQDHYRYWSDGPLTWKDFTLSDSLDAKPNLSVSWVRDYSVVKSGKTTYKYLEIRTIAVPANSFVGKSRITDENLRKQQDFFNQAEWIGRALRDSLLTSRLSPKALTKWAAQRIREDEERLSGDEGFTVIPPGKDSFDITAFPCSPSKFGVGVSLNLGGSVPTGDMARLGSLFISAGTDLEIIYDRFYFDAGVVFGRGTYKGDIPGISGSGSKGQFLDSFGWSIGPGYIFLKQDDTRLSVFGCLGSKSIFFKPDPVQGMSVIEGVRLDYTLRNRYSFALSGLYTRTVLQARIYADQVYSPSKGILIPSLDASIGLAFSWHGIKND